MSKSIKAPIAEKKNHSIEKHGDKREDPYYWLRDRENPQVIAYLTAENEYLEKSLEKLKPLREQLFQELKGRIKEDDTSAPYKDGDYWYYRRNEKGKEYPIYCRKKTLLSNKEEVILDVNQLAKGYSYYQVGALSISPNARYLAYTYDNVGRRNYTLRVKDLDTGKLLDLKVFNTAGSVDWANDNQTLFFVRKNPQTLRSEKVFRIDTKKNKEVEVYHEADETFSVGVGRSLSNKFLFLITASTDSSEVRYLDANNPEGQWSLFLPREPKHEYSIEDGGEAFIVRTNWKAANFRLMKASYGPADKDNWQELFAHDSSRFVEDFLAFEKFLVVQFREQGLLKLRVLSKGRDEKEILFPDPNYVVDFGANAEFKAESFRYVYESLVKPRTEFDYHLETKKSFQVWQKEVPGFDPSKYESKRIFISVRDKTKVPVSVVYRKDRFKKSSNPLLVYGYGSYGYSLDANFRSTIFSLVDRGFVFAIAHVRGGQELGRSWYEEGRQLKKKNSFFDFIDVSEQLLVQGLGKPKHVYAMGGSAGGLLMGAIINMRPDLYRGVVAQVPFVDVVTTMLDDSIPLTTSEYDEWGNPNDKVFYDYMKSYSPYDNVEKKNYPALLVTTGLHDSQVQYWEPAKWVAKLREMKTGNEPLYLFTQMQAGHGGASGRYESLKEDALEQAFLLHLED